MVVVADLGTALVPVITAVVVFWVAGLERRYMLRVLLIGGGAGADRRFFARLSPGPRHFLFRSELFEDRDDRYAWLASRLRAELQQSARRELSAAAIENRGRAPAACSASA